jgi:nicotinate phosphoribosyltransferase
MKGEVMAHIAEWGIRLYLDEEDDDTTLARVVLDTGTNTLTGEGRARRNPHDAPVPEIGDEVAAARALGDLARKLTEIAAGDIDELSKAR